MPTATSEIQDAPETVNLSEIIDTLVDAGENLLIALGMGWDTQGSEEVLRHVIAKARDAA